jgi:serine/threonine protein kinase/tetratricopeptide (TPR) repeat protein
VASQRDLSSIGLRVGNIRVLSRLGEGGMGAVFVGIDEKLQRRVALKAIRSDRRLDAMARARFLREARILSQLDDPKICRIYDYLESEFGDFLVLELIEGRNLRDAQAEGLERLEILELAEQLAAVLATAHAKGVIHRDLKPDNLMRTPEGQLKILDFGLAHATALAADPVVGEALAEGDEELTSKVKVVVQDRPPDADSGWLDDATRVLFEDSSSDTVLGTVGYMSPEQARGERLTPASDMYSFGVVLQELLTGRPPYEKRLTPAMVLVKVAQAESEPPTGLPPDLCHLIKALKARAPSDRPTGLETVSRLQAIRDAPRRRLRRVLIGGAVVALVAFGFKYMGDLRREEKAAIAARKESEDVLRFVVQIFAGANPEEHGGREVTAREIVEKASLGLRRALDEQPLARARLLAALSAIDRNLGLFEPATALAREALVLRENNLPKDDPLIADSLDQLASLYWNQARNQEAESLLLRCLGIRERHFGKESVQVADSLNDLGNNYSDIGRFAEAENFYRQSLALRRKLLRPGDPLIGSSLQNLAIVLTAVGQYPEAEQSFKEAWEIKAKALGGANSQLGRIANNLGELYAHQSRIEDAEAQFLQAQSIWERSLGPEHPTIAWALHRRANLYRDHGRLSEALPLYARALGLRRRALAPNHPETLLLERDADAARDSATAAGLSLPDGL